MAWGSLKRATYCGILKFRGEANRSISSIDPCASSNLLNSVCANAHSENTGRFRDSASAATFWLPQMWRALNWTPLLHRSGNSHRATDWSADDLEPSLLTVATAALLSQKTKTDLGSWGIFFRARKMALTSKTFILTEGTGCHDPWNR